MSKKELLPETSTQMRDSLSDMVLFLLRNIDWVLGQRQKIMTSSKKDEKRSLGDDLIKLNERFKTKIEIEGVENIPSEGGLVLVFSHLVNTKKFPGWENKKAHPFWWLLGITQALRKRRGSKADFRPIFKFLAGTSIGDFWKRAIGVYRGFPVSPKTPRESLKSLDEAIKAAEKGETILIAPEGGTHVALTQAKRGVARLAKSHCPFVPLVYIEELTIDQQFRYIIKIGEPVYPPENVDQWRRKEEIEFTENLMRRIAQLLPSDQRGVYQI